MGSEMCIRDRLKNNMGTEFVRSMREIVKTRIYKKNYAENAATVSKTGASVVRDV